MGNQPPSGQGGAPGGDPGAGDPRNLQQAAAAANHPRVLPPGYGGPPSGPYGMPGYSAAPGAGGGAGISHSYHGTTQSAPASADQQQMPKSTSDASMTMMDGTDGTGGLGGLVGGQQPGDGMADATNLEAFLNDDTVPTVFRWEHGGRQVYITGTFNGWSRQIPMHRSGNDFTYIHNLKRGKHAFKFIVDDEWRFAPDQPTVADIEGRINNFIDVTEFKPYTGDREFEKEKAAADYGCSSIDTEPLEGQQGEEGMPASGGASTATATASGTPNSAGKPTQQEDDALAPGATSGVNKPDRDGEIFNNTMPDLDDYTKEPPPLPPHLRHIILNKPPQLQDTAALPVPQHVALNHLYCTAIKDNMMVLGITQRYKTKFVTTVYYSPCASK